MDRGVGNVAAGPRHLAGRNVAVAALGVSTFMRVSCTATSKAMHKRLEIETRLRLLHVSNSSIVLLAHSAKNCSNPLAVASLDCSINLLQQ